MNDEELGLPRPKQYDGELFTVLDYFSEDYAEAETLDEAIAMRGARAFSRDVTPEDFANDTSKAIKKLGIAELWFDSTWRQDESDNSDEPGGADDSDESNKYTATQRDVEREQLVDSIKEGDLLEVRLCSEKLSDWGYRFHLPFGQALPYSPYHDYDDQFFQQALDSLDEGEGLICQVREVTCFGEDGTEMDPGFCWRVYSCKVTVYLVK